ncbi:hypothetical protein BW687_002500 [Pseudomonas graminis]|uniref:hypothetical protein n=1 Tax=Pseudomonas graminis TaxID=158627 RepID=UPI002349ED3C|nr:hypothetical protein [Pseudomonas graminis]MDC6379045.1 hypothetical protein [Pseudomonas graminis]
MASVSKQQKRAKRAKTKAKEQRVARQHPQTPDPIVPDYFMPDFFSEDDAELDDVTLLKNFVEPDILETMDEEEREAMAAVIRGEADETSITEDEMLLMEVYQSPAPEPSQEQRLAHYEVLKVAEQKGFLDLLDAFAKGPIAAHAFYDFNFDDYLDVLVNTLGAYMMWAHGLDEATVRARIHDDDFYEAFRAILSEIEMESTMEMLGIDRNKHDEPAQD